MAEKLWFVPGQPRTEDFVLGNQTYVDPMFVNVQHCHSHNVPQRHQIVRCSYNDMRLPKQSV